MALAITSLTRKCLKTHLQAAACSPVRYGTIRAKSEWPKTGLLKICLNLSICDPSQYGVSIIREYTSQPHRSSCLRHPKGIHELCGIMLLGLNIQIHFRSKPRLFIIILYKLGKSMHAFRPKLTKTKQKLFSLNSVIKC